MTNDNINRIYILTPDDPDRKYFVIYIYRSVLASYDGWEVSFCRPHVKLIHSCPVTLAYTRPPPARIVNPEHK